MKLRARDLVVISLCILLAIVLIGAKADAGPVVKMDHLIITEVMLQNASSVPYASGEFEDYIECYNPTEQPIQLSDYYLTDSNKKVLKWQLPNAVLEPGRFVIFFTTGMGVGSETNFQLSDDGEGLILSDKEGKILQELLVEKAGANISYGMNTETLTYSYYLQGSPLAMSTGFHFDDPKAFADTCRIDWSQQGGVYGVPVTLTLSTQFEGAEIRYTTDGKEPTIESPIYASPLVIEDTSKNVNRYAGLRGVSPSASNSGPNMISNRPVTKGTVVRAGIFMNGTRLSAVQTQTFFVLEDGKDHYALPIVSLTTDPENLFDDEKGIYWGGNVLKRFTGSYPNVPVDGSIPANYNQEGPEWERPASFEYFVDGERVFSQDIGVSTFGGWSRANVKKSLKIKADIQYDPNHDTLDYPLIRNALDKDGKTIQTYKNIALRGGANDYENSIFRDEMIQSLAMEMNVSTQGYEAVNLFLDGEYWGIYWMREVQDRHYVQQHFPVSSEDVTVIVNNGELYEGNEDGLAAYYDLMSFFEEADLSDPAQYEKAKSLMDIPSLIDYQWIQIYSANTDWPGNNLKLWKGGVNSPPEYQKWRYMLFDTDFGFALYPFHKSTVDTNNLSSATATNGPDWPNPPWSTLILRKLLENPEFKTQFLERGKELMKTTLSAEAVPARIQQFVELLTPDMPENIQRYNLYPLPDMNAWEKNVKVMTSFGKLRPGYVEKFIKFKEK